MNGIGKCFNKFQQINIINFWQRCASCRKSGYAAVSGDSFPKIITSWWSTNSGHTFGTRRSQVQILPRRPLNPLILNAFSKTVYSPYFSPPLKPPLKRTAIADGDAPTWRRSCSSAQTPLERGAYRFGSGRQDDGGAGEGTNRIKQNYYVVGRIKGLGDAFVAGAIEVGRRHRAAEAGNDQAHAQL